MARTVDNPAPARERILDTASALFYRDGFRAVGIDTIIARSGVAKMTLYYHVPSKDELIAAYLERSNERFWAWLDEAIADAEAPRAKLIAIFEAVAALATSPECLGCTFQGTAAEFPDRGHPAHRVAQAHKRAVLERLRTLSAQTGTDDPDDLARALLLLMDGAFAAARMFDRPDSPAGSIARAAEALIDARLAGGTQRRRRAQ